MVCKTTIPQFKSGWHLQISADRVRAAVAGPPDTVDIAVGAYVWAEEFLKALLALLRRRGFRDRIILGGPQIS